MADFQELGLRFVPVNDAAANKALTDVAANSEKAEVASKKLTATQQSAANAQRMVAEANRLNTSALGQMAQAIQAADAAQRAALASTKNLGTAVQTAAAQAKAASVSFNTFYDAAERDFATQYVGSMNKVVGVHGKAVGSSKAMTQATLNLSRQFADVGVTAAMGMSPLMILIQQGPQIADAFSMAKTQGIGFSDIMRNMKGVIGPLIPIIAGVGAVLGVVVGGFALFEREIDKNTKYATTWGDTWNATVHVVGDAIMNGPIGTGLRWLGKFFGTVMDAMVDGVTWWADKTVGHFGAAYQMIVKHWRQLPQVFGVIMQGAANISIQAIEGLINKTIQGVNYLLKAAGKQALAMIDLPEIKLANAKLAAEYDTLAEGISSSFRKGRERFGDQIAAQADREYLSRQKATKAVKDHTAALKEHKEALDRTQPITAEMSKAVDLSETKAVKMTAAIRELNGELKQMPVYIDPSVTAMEDFMRSFNDAGYGVDQLFNGLKNRDWISAVAGLIRAGEAVSKAFKTGTTADKVGAIAGVAGAAGQAIGGTAGSTLSGAAAGAMAGFQLGTIIPGIGNVVGAIGGAIIGGIAGLLGGNSRKKAEKAAREQAAREAEAQRQAQILQQRQQLELALVEATGSAVEILAAQRKAELAGIDESNKALAEQLYRARDEKRVTDEAVALQRQLQAMDDAILGTNVALTAARADELKALDPTNRYLAELIYARQDEAVAIEKAAQATADLTKAYEVLFAGQIEQAARVAEIATYDRRARYAEQAADREKALKATEAATEAQAKLAETSMAAAKAALLAGDGLSALSEHMKVSADLARLAQQTNAAGSFNAGNFNAAFASIQSRAALPLLQEASLGALRIENATKAVTDLMGVYLAPRSRELGGQTVAPVGDGLGIASIMARQGEALASFTTLQDQWFAGIIKGQEATDLFAEAAEDAGAAIARAGLDSLGLYFRDISTATAELNAQAALAAEPISQVAQAIGRLNSIADVFTMSASAALGAGLTPDVEKAALIAQSAAIASQAMITADAAKIAEKIAGDAAFGALSKAGIRDAAMLLDGLKGNDARSFEAAFLRINNALVTGAVTQEQYQVLFGAAMDTFEGLDDKVAATAQTFADLRLSAQKLAADLRMDAGINPAGAAGAFAASQDRYEGLFSSVLGGNTGAFSDFASTAQAMLSNAKSTFATGLEYDRLFGRTLNDVDQLATLPTPQAHEDRMESLAAENNAELKALKATVQALLEEQQRSNRSQNQNGRLQTETLRQTVAPDSGTA